MPGLSQLEEALDTFSETLISAYDRLPICGLEQSSFSYDLPDNGIAEIFGYLHVDNYISFIKTALRKKANMMANAA
jgi:hypothetical protein